LIYFESLKHYFFCKKFILVVGKSNKVRQACDVILGE
jgi:hypothetical protein